MGGSGTVADTVCRRVTVYSEYMSPDPQAASPNASGERYECVPPFAFHRRVAAVPGVGLLFLVNTGCGACRRWKALLRDFVLHDPGITVFEVDAGQDQALAREFGVFHLPALFLFQDGRYHCRLEAEAQRERLQAAIVGALARSPEEPP